MVWRRARGHLSQCEALFVQGAASVRAAGAVAPDKGWCKLGDIEAGGEREPTGTERVRAFVSQLRAKLGDDAARAAFIVNERGVGYRMARPARTGGRPLVCEDVAEAVPSWDARGPVRGSRPPRCARALLRRRGLGGGLGRFWRLSLPARDGVRNGAKGVVTGAKSGLPANGGKGFAKNAARAVACSFLAACPDRRTMRRRVT